MRIVEQIKLTLRAKKYKNKDDIGGIAYLHDVIKKGQTVLDIGAHKAGYLYFILKLVGSSGHVFAFEPQTVLFEYIKKIKNLFNWQNVRIEHLALSDTAGEVTLYIPANKKSKASSPGATIATYQDQSNFGATETVTTDTLDAYCDKHQIEPDFLKIDVEGNELNIFKGGVNTLNKYKPKIIVEIEARHVGKEKVLETFAFMQSLGYAGYLIHGVDRLPIAVFSFEKYQNEQDMKNYCNNFVFE